MGQIDNDYVNELIRQGWIDNIQVDTNVEEIWLPLQGFEDIYRVSNYGIIKRLNHRNSGKEYYIKYRYDKDGYQRCAIITNGKPINTAVHRIVAQTFIPNPLNKPMVNHKDGVKRNNKVWNLEWVTHSENEIHARKTGLKKGLRGESIYCTKLKENEIREMRIMWNSDKYTLIEIANIYNTGYKNVHKIVTNQRWKHII